MAITKNYTLEGLCCGNCAVKIEEDVKKLPGVSIASVDFVSKTLDLSMENAVEEYSIVPQIKEIIKRHDPDITLIEQASNQPGQKSLYLMGLHCADCASKIERQVGELKGVKSAQLDFVSQKLTIEAEDRKELSSLLRQASDIALSIEPGIEIAYTNKKPLDEKKGAKKWLHPLLLGIGALLFLLGLLIDFSPPLELAVFLAAYLLVGGEVVLRALRNITKGQVFDENFLMSIATIGAFAIGEYPEGVAVMLFYQIGEAFQRLAVNRSRKSISALMDIRPDFANLKVGDEVRKVSPEEVGIGDIILVRPGKRYLWMVRSWKGYRHWTLPLLPVNLCPGM